MAQPIVLVDGSSWPLSGGWSVAAVAVCGGGTRTLARVVTRKQHETLDCSVVELLAILAGCRLARQLDRQDIRWGSTDVVVVDRPAVFSYISAAVEPGHGRAARRPALASCIDILLNDLARASLRRGCRGCVIMLSRLEAIRRGILLETQLAHTWIPHALITHQCTGGNSSQGDILADLEADGAILLSTRPRERCRWTCRTDRSTHLTLTCLPVNLPPVRAPLYPPPLPQQPLPQPSAPSGTAPLTPASDDATLTAAAMAGSGPSTPVPSTVHLQGGLLAGSHDSIWGPVLPAGFFRYQPY